METSSAWTPSTGDPAASRNVAVIVTVSPLLTSTCPGVNVTDLTRKPFCSCSGLTGGSCALAEPTFIVSNASNQVEAMADVKRGIDTPMNVGIEWRMAEPMRVIRDIPVGWRGCALFQITRIQLEGFSVIHH